MTTALVWFRRDLRIEDNPALDAALDRHDTILPVYIHDPDSEQPWPPGEASNWWLHHSLAALQQALQCRGAKLHIASGPSKESLDALCEATGAVAVYWNRVYEPAAMKRDQAIKASLRERSIEAKSFGGSLLFEPFALETGSGGPYRVFTPFWRRASADLQSQLASGRAPLPAPERVSMPRVQAGGLELETLGLLPNIAWDSGFSSRWAPGCETVREQVEDFIESNLSAYAKARDIPGEAGTSRLSAALHFGDCSPLQVVHWIRQANAMEKGAAFVRELGWREFAHHLLYHYPATTDQPLNAQFKAFPWRRRKDYASDLKRWQQGQTGVPIVDAGMRELWTTGWMHNRVRMIVASFLTKNLRIPWQEGAAWFWDTLVDADLANNTLGWQWVAGCGADAAPYFRIFNPVLQSARFDEKGNYLRQWVPELASLPDKHLHAPWEAPAEVLKKAKVSLGQVYPEPMVDLKASREAALQAYQDIKGR